MSAVMKTNWLAVAKRELKTFDEPIREELQLLKCCFGRFYGNDPRFGEEDTSHDRCRSNVGSDVDKSLDS